MLFSSHFFEHPAEDLHALDNFIVRWGREIESDGVALSVDIGQKCSAGDERDHVLGGFFDELKRVNILGQLAPDEQTALGTDIADRVAKLAVYHIAHEIELSAVYLSYLADAVVVHVDIILPLHIMVKDFLILILFPLENIVNIDICLL